MQISVAVIDHGSAIAIRTTSQSASCLKDKASRRTVAENADMQQPSVQCKAL